MRDAIASDAAVREAGLFGIHGGHINVTDGRYVYMRAPADESNEPLANYTLMPTHMRGPFSTEELKTAEMAEPFEFTKGLRTMRIQGRPWRTPHEFGTLLFDLESDPKQENPIQDEEVEGRMVEHMVRLMKENDAPTEQYERMGVDG